MPELTCLGIDEVSPVVAVMAGGLEFGRAGNNHAGSVIVTYRSVGCLEHSGSVGRKSGYFCDRAELIVVHVIAPVIAVASIGYARTAREEKRVD